MIKFSLLVTVFAILSPALAHADSGDVTIFRSRLTNGVKTEFTRDLNHNMKAVFQNSNGIFTLSVQSTSGRKVISAWVDQKASMTSGCYQDIVATGFNGPTSILMYLKTVSNAPKCATLKKSYDTTLEVGSFDIGDNDDHSGLALAIYTFKKLPSKFNWDLNLYSFMTTMERIH